jgi:hydroxylysine kinase
MIIDPILTTRPPQIGPADAEQLCASLYGMAMSAHEVGGERDRNFRMTADNGQQYLLKISNPAETPDMVNLQTSALDYILAKDPGVCVPRNVKTCDGSAETKLTLADGRDSIVRLLTYLQGTPLINTEPTTQQRQALGAGLARLNLALCGFSHPASHHELPWNVSIAEKLKPMIATIEEPARRALLDRFMADYEGAVMPILPGLRAQVIHNDFNLGNVLVEADRPDVIAAIIDFGDIVHAPLVGEVATAAAYQFARCDDPLTGAAEFIGAYDRVIPLTPDEREIVADLVAARLMITVLITQWRASRYPENRTYIMRNNALAWDGLERLGQLSRDQARARLLHHCDTGEQP